MVQLELLLKLFPQKLTLNVVISLLHVYCVLVLEFSVVKLDLLLGLDFLSLVVESLLHLISEALLLFLHDFELCLVPILELFESFPVPALLTCQFIELCSLSIHCLLSCQSCLLQMLLQKSYLVLLLDSRR